MGKDLVHPYIQSITKKVMCNGRHSYFPYKHCHSMLHTLHTRSLLIFAPVPILRLMELLQQKLCTVGLSPRWVPILREEVGIRTPDGLKYVGMELYPLLLQFVMEPHEKVALLNLLKGEDSITKFLRKRKALTDSLRSFKSFKSMGRIVKM